MKTLWQDADMRIFLDEIPREWPPSSFLLSENELSYCLQSKNESTQRSRAKLRLMVKEILDDANVEVTQGPLGRPLISPRLDLSFSHKDDCALVGLTSAPSRLGVDIESLDQKIDWSVFTDRFFTAMDLSSIQMLADQEGWTWHQAHLCLFSLKEAFFKAYDTHFIPSHVDLIFSHMTDGLVHFKAQHKSENIPLRGQQLRLFAFRDDKNVITVCHVRNLD